jgi:hypothetical protein
VIEKPKDPKADPKPDKAVARDANELADLPKAQQELTDEQAKNIKGGTYGHQMPLI